MEFQAAFDDDKGTVKRPFRQYFIGEFEIHILHIFCRLHRKFDILHFKVYRAHELNMEVCSKLFF